MPTHCRRIDRRNLSRTYLDTEERLAALRAMREHLDSLIAEASAKDANIGSDYDDRYLLALEATRRLLR